MLTISGNPRYNDYLDCLRCPLRENDSCVLLLRGEVGTGELRKSGRWFIERFFLIDRFFEMREWFGRRSSPLVLTLVLAGCGSVLPNADPVVFVNHTQHSDADLQAIWKAAQQTLSQAVDLNPVQRIGNNVPAEIKPGDPRAFTVKPHQLLVSSQQDVSSSALLAATNVYRADPTGLISCPQPCNVRFAAAYSFPPKLTRYAASWEFQGDNFSLLLQYEFENQILAKLGYSLRWR
jgi:hypothetical protein